MAFTRESATVDGIRVEYLTAGSGEPLVFFHGAGTTTGFDFALKWAERYRVIIPFHPGFDGSDDYPNLTSVHDYVMHYLGFLDALGLARINLVGFSLGGFVAAKFAMQHSDRLRRLVLAAPAGMRHPEHPTRDVLAIPPEKLPGMLVWDIETIRHRLPSAPDADFMAARYRETTTVARLLWDRPTDPKLAFYIHRITAPALIVWGEEDQLVPIQQADVWMDRLPDARLRTFPKAGHLVFDEAPAAVEEVMAFLD